MYFVEVAPRFNPIGIDLRWLWQAVQDWQNAGFQFSDKATQHFPPFILIIFSWLSAFNFQDAYKLHSTTVLLVYLATALYLPYLISTRLNCGWQGWLTSLPFTLLGMSAYGMQFEIERGQWNLLSYCLSLSAIYLYKSGDSKRILGAIILLTIAAQMKIWPALFFILFVYKSQSYLEIMRISILYGLVNTALLLCFGFDAFLGFFDSVMAIGDATNLGVAQTSIAALLWLVERDYPSYLILSEILVALLLFSLIATVVYMSLTKKDLMHGQEFMIFFVMLLTLVLPGHGNDYKLSMVPVTLAIMSPFMFSTSVLRGYVWPIFNAFFVLFLYSTYYSYDSKPVNIFVQNTVTSLLLAALVGLIFVLLMHQSSNRDCVHPSAS